MWEALQKIRSILDREKPAHTDYHLCVVEPTMRVGFQARVGIDTIVAGTAADMVLGDPNELGEDTVISHYGGIRRKAGQLERDSRIGIKTTVD